MKDTSNTSEQFLYNGGECGELLRSIDWPKHPLGPPAYWPQSLKSTVGIILHSRFPMFLWWGTELFCFYNDAYRPSLGENGKHPSIMGQPAKESWPEIWDIIHPLIEQVLSGGGATWSEDQLIPIFRNGKMEDVYWTFSYSPVTDETGEIAGVLVTCSETTDKIEVLQKLKESKNELEFAIDAAQLGTWDYNPLNNKFKGNDRLKEWFGLSQDAEIDLQIAIDAIVDKDKERVVSAISKALDPSSGGQYEIEYSIIHPDTKKETVVHAKGMAWFNNEHIAYRFNGTLEDVTEKATARKKIEEGNVRFLNNIIQAPVAMAILRGKDHIVEVANAHILEIWGHTSEEVINKPIFEGLPEARGQGLEELLAHIYNTGEKFSANERSIMLPRNGKLENTFINFVYESLKEADGSISGIVVIAVDVTEQVTARTKIEESEHKFRTIIEEATVATAFYVGQTLTVQYANELMIGYWGKDNSVIGKPLNEAVPELDGQPFLDILKNVYATGEPYIGVEEFAKLNVGGQLQEFYFNFTYKAIRNNSGEIYAIHHMAVDVTEQVKSKSALIESEKKFRETVRQAPVGIAILRGPEFVVEMANQKYLELVDRDQESFVGKTLFEGIPEVRELVEPLLNGVVSSGIPFVADDLQVSIKRFGKEEIGYFSLVYHPLKEKDGHISGVMVVATEVSDSVKAKHNLAESELRFRNLVMQSPIPMTIWRGKDHVIEIANHAMLNDIWRKKEDEILGKKALEVFPELLDQKYPELLESVMSTGKSHTEKESVAYVTGNDGTKKFYLDFEYAPLFEQDGSVSGLMITVNDVTEKVESRQKIEESETYFRRMADSVPVMIWVTEKDGPCTYVNKQWFEYTGQKFEDSLGYGWLDTIHPDDKYYTEKIFRENILTEQSFNVEYRLKNAKGEYMWVVAVASPRRSADGQFEGYIGTVSDINDRRTAESKITESEERSRLAIDAAELGTYEWIIGTPDTIASDRFLYLFNVDPQEKTDRNDLLKRFHPEDVEIHRQAHREAQETGLLSYEARLIWEDQSIHWIKIKGKIVYDEAGNPKKMLGTAMDITDQKVALSALKESELRYRQLIEGLPVAIYTVDINGKIKIYNEAAVNLWGREPEEGNEMWCGSHTIYDSSGKWVAHEECPMAIALKENRALTAEIIIERPSGDVRHVLVHPQPIHDIKGNSLGAINAMVDISDLKRFEQALKTSESRLAEAQRIATIGNWEYGYNDKSFYCSDEVYRILATSSEEFVPSFYNLFRIIHPQDIKKLSRTLSFTSKTGLPFNIDFRIITEDDNIKHINSQGYVLLDNNQKIIKIIGTLQDITMRKLVEEELMEAKRVSEKSLRYKEQFLANMSHEIRTPMNAIVGFTELILNTPLQPEQKQFLEAIKTSGENLLVIINDILDFSKVEAGAIHFEHIDFKLSEVVFTLTDLMLPKSVEKGIKLSVSINPSISDNLMGDPTRLNQILLNLVGNAIKFTEKGEIKISAEPVWQNEESIEIRFSVSDTGIGIDENMQNAIFDVFTQTASDTTRKYGGSGLGLAIVKQFVEKQGGKISLESSPGKGSIFSFTLTFDKFSTPALSNNVIAAEPMEERSQLKLSVLLVEDNKLNQLLASKALSDLEWEVDIADNGLIAVDKVAQNDYDIILMDIQLPEMDGYEATRYIRSRYDAPKNRIPIIAVTAHAMQSEAQKCHDAGMDGYISKPFSPKMLVEGILKVLKMNQHTP
jgi:PAS domain S-box-containing protein